MCSWLNWKGLGKKANPTKTDISAQKQLGMDTFLKWGDWVTEDVREIAVLTADSWAVVKGQVVMPRKTEINRKKIRLLVLLTPCSQCSLTIYSIHCQWPEVFFGGNTTNFYLVTSWAGWFYWLWDKFLWNFSWRLFWGTHFLSSLHKYMHT